MTDGPSSPFTRGSDLDPDRVDRIVAVYLVVAGVWIAVSSPLADLLSDRLDLPLAALELGKGLGFVLATAIVLRLALRRWAGRVQRAAEQERAAAERMRQAEELRSAFLNGVSHELRTPLTSIIGYGSTVQRLSAELRFDQIGALAERLVVNAQRLEVLVLDLLDADALLRGLGRLRTQRVRIDEVVERVAATVDHGDRSLELRGDAVPVSVDVPKFERIVQYLLDNAIRHTPDTAHVRVRWESAGGDLVLTVEDDGPGLPADVAEHLFEPFVQGTPARSDPNPGMGIGLTLVDQYVRLHGGRVTATNRPEGGARVEVRIPAQRGPDARAA